MRHHAPHGCFATVDPRKELASAQDLRDAASTLRNDVGTPWHNGSYTISPKVAVESPSRHLGARKEQNWMKKTAVGYFAIHDSTHSYSTQSAMFRQIFRLGTPMPPNEVS